jgi:hypothetical protein
MSLIITENFYGSWRLASLGLISLLPGFSSGSKRLSEIFGGFKNGSRFIKNRRMLFIMISSLHEFITDAFGVDGRYRLHFA